MEQSSIQDTFLFQCNERGDQTMNETLDEQSRQAPSVAKAFNLAHSLFVNFRKWKVEMIK